MSAHWYALRSKSRKERALYQQVKSREIEAFYPQVKVNPVNPRAAKTRSYFPGYLFVYTDIEVVGFSTFEWMPFSHGLVTFGGDPTNVPLSLILAIKNRLEEINAQGGISYDGLEKGAQVLINNGAFKGYRVIFDSKLDGKSRVRVLLELINGRQVPLDLKVGQVTVDNGR